MRVGRRGKDSWDPRGRPNLETWELVMVLADGKSPPHRCWRSPTESDTSASPIATPAIGKLAVEAGEQRRIFVKREPRAGIDLQCVAPGARTVDREQRTRY